MNFKFVLALSAAALMVGCSKCSQQPQTETPPVEAVPPPVEPMGSEGSTAETLPNSEQMNEELPPGDADGSGE